MTSLSARTELCAMEPATAQIRTTKNASLLACGRETRWRARKLAESFAGILFVATKGEFCTFVCGRAQHKTFNADVRNERLL